MEKYAVIVAGGTGVRMSTSMPKQFLLLNNKPVLWHTLAAFLTAFSDMQIILVLPQQYIETGEAIILSTCDPQRIQITTGGETRFHSVKNGLDCIQKESFVFVHDGVRCLVTAELIRSCYEVALAKGNAVPAIKASDSIRIESANGNQLIDRDTVRIIQTPQTFLSSIIKPAFEQVYNNAFTDEAIVVEKTGVKINLIEGESTNIKITRPLDMMIAEKILEERSMNI
jgi:2-C-methyl-D-erythritol 4-phosphate cytidylyltransferase